MTREFLHVDVPGGRLAGETWAGARPTLVLLHSGVTDRRSWYETADRLSPGYSLVAYDRRGFGQSVASSEVFSHVKDLSTLLDALDLDQVWLVASSAGGRVALDATLTHPERVAGLVLLAPAISGAPDIESLDPETQRLDTAIDQATDAGDLAEANRLEARLWLDGPAGPEGRVSGPVRELFFEMNAIALKSEAESAAEETEVSAWSRLADITVPVTVAWGERDVPVLNERCQQIVDRLPNATGRQLPRVAHLPYLEDPDLTADLIRRAVVSGR
ncbi:MAG TPA: alpha/beta hydrolase [Propionibacteriaceae bacterium]|jgi:pimeloyl-ACP methyl ester carboxylesterase|nr:alpha/beta hydrolase [Propionibacteriaceae bacterium]